MSNCYRYFYIDNCKRTNFVKFFLNILNLAIITGLKALIGKFDMELELREREKEYISSRDQGDPNFYLTVFTPCVICKSYLVMIIMIEKSKMILTVFKILIKIFSS